MKSSDLGQLGIDLEIVITAAQNTQEEGLGPSWFPNEGGTRSSFFPSRKFAAEEGLVRSFLAENNPAEYGPPDLAAKPLQITSER